MSKANATDTLILEKTKTERSVEPVTALSLIDWAKSILNKKNEWVIATDKHEKTSADLSKFGLQTPDDVIRFLQTPAGETVRTEILEHIAQEESLKDELQAKAIEHQLFMHRLKAFFLMLFIEHKTHAADYIKDLIAQQNEKTIRNEKKAIQENASLSKINEHYKKELSEILSNYDQLIKKVNHDIQQNTIERKSLLTTAEQLKIEGQQLENKYTQYIHSLHSLEHSSDMKQLMSIEQVQNQIHDLTKKLTSHAEKISELSTTNEHEQSNLLKTEHETMTHELAHLQGQHEQILTNIQNKIAELTQSMLPQIEQINQLSLSNDEKKLRELVEKNNAINLQIAELHDMHAVYKGHKCLFNAKGICVNSFNEANFIVPKEHQIVEENGKYYLLKPSQTWKDVKENPQLKEEAQHQFERKKHEFMRVKKVVQHNHDIEKTLHHEKVNVNQKQLLINQEQQLTLQNQNNLLQSSKASVQHLLATGNFSKEAPRPTPTMKPTSNAPKPSQNTSTLFYREQLQSLRTSTEVFPKTILNLLTQLPDTKNPRVAELINSVKAMRSTAPIPLATMRSLLENMERFGIDAYRPSVSHVKKPQETPQSTAKLTPFSMTPNPYKK